MLGSSLSANQPAYLRLIGGHGQARPKNVSSLVFYFAQGHMKPRVKLPQFFAGTCRPPSHVKQFGSTSNLFVARMSLTIFLQVPLRQDFPHKYRSLETSPHANQESLRRLNSNQRAGTSEKHSQRWGRSLNCEPFWEPACAACCLLLALQPPDCPLPPAVCCLLLTASCMPPASIADPAAPQITS